VQAIFYGLICLPNAKIGLLRKRYTPRDTKIKKVLLNNPFIYKALRKETVWQGVGWYDAVEAHKRYSPIDCLTI
jgi:hypothetical protein